jgi:hypothetical protein
LVPLGREAGGTGNQLSSDHFERAVDDFELELQKSKLSLIFITLVLMQTWLTRGSLRLIREKRFSLCH